MKKIYIILLAAVLSAGLVSCKKDSIGGTINSTERLDITNFEWLRQTEETAVVADLFERAGLRDAVDAPDVTIVGPSKWSVERYVRRRNYPWRTGVEGATEFKLEDLTPEELSRMGMYIFPGQWSSDQIPDEGVYLTSVDGTQEIYLYREAQSADPGAAWNGAGAPGAGYQYGNFMMSNPMIVYAVFKRGSTWEVDEKTGKPSYLARYALGLQGSETDQAYRMYLSDVHTANGIIHIVIMGNTAYTERYQYHTLFFYGTRSDDY
jgi:hypothetical protein